MSSTTRKRPELFTYPPLPEIKVCWLVTLGALIYAWSLVYKESQRFEWHIGDQASVKNLPLIGKRFKDEANWEWGRWSPYALHYLPIYAAHFVVFNVGTAVLSDKIFVPLYTLLSMAATAYTFTPLLVFYSIIQGLLVFTASTLIPRQLTVWISSIPILFYIMHNTHSLHTDPFLVLLFVAYSLLSYISFCLEAVARSPDPQTTDKSKDKSTTPAAIRPEDDTVLKKLLRMYFYTFYQPYLVSVIVLYEDFEKQLVERKTRSRDWVGAGWYAVRLAFWWLLTDLLLHFCYFESMLNHIDYVEKMDKKAFVALGMALGQFFHLKYVVIFGLPSLFARLDNMQPLPGPMCLARVCLYSKVWRCFDRGLYAFFKKYIFIPICQPDFSLHKKIFGVVVSYSFVLLWHGFYHNNIVWIALNIAAMFIEMSSKAFYASKGGRAWTDSHFSPLTLRRMLGWLQIIPFAFGLYSNFYFLGGSEVGGLYVDRVLLEETVTLRPFFWGLITLGYFYTQTTMEVDRWETKTKTA